MRTATRSASPVAVQARYVRLQLEGLEERIVPDAYTWTGAVSNDYTDAANWNNNTRGGNGVPGSMDTAFIPNGGLVVLNGPDQAVAGLTVVGHPDDGFPRRLHAPPGTVFPVLTAGSIGTHFDTTPPNMTVNYGSDAVTLTQN